MRIFGTEVILSPSDLMRFQGCAHATALDLRLARGEALVPAEDDASAALLQKKGHAHEQAHLQAVAVGDWVEIERTSDFAEAVAKTKAAMEAGVGLIYQGALATGPFQGWSDFLERVEAPSDLGAWSYEVADTKLARHASPKHAVQLAVYSRAVAEFQGRLPEHIHVVLGSGERETLPLTDVIYYADRLANRLEAFVATPFETRSDPCSACGLCRWREHCDAEWEATDSLVRVAGITKQQRRRLERAGVSTLTALAAFQDKATGISTSVLARLKTQARLQKIRDEGGSPAFELKPADPGRGFDLMPKPSKGDLFFDMEGDPLIEGGLEYLFGIHHARADEDRFEAFWAHSRDEEREALMKTLIFFAETTGSDPDAHIYHYNHYEPTALKRLTQFHGVGEAILDDLLRRKVFVDLYRVVQQGLIASEPGYSLKNLEAFYMEKREGEVATASDSIVAYETWLETGDTDLLENIERYNEVDCRSTKGLRDWLLSIRPASAIWRETVPATAPDVRSIEAGEEQEVRIDVRDDDGLRTLLARLCGFHRRAAKPQWWEYFDRLERDRDELVDDLESLAGLEAISDPDGFRRTYRFPRQETKMREKKTVIARSLERNVTIEAMDREGRTVALKGTRNTGPLPEVLDLVPGKPIGTDPVVKGLLAVIVGLARHTPETRAIRDFLKRHPPRLRGRTLGEAILQDGRDFVDEVVAAVQELDRGCLPIQGPPGTGKTYVSARAIVDLVRSGKRVAVSSNAHKAIDNLLLAVAAEAEKTGSKIEIVKKDGGDHESPDHPMIQTASDNDDPILMSADVVGGTAWLLAREDFERHFDVLFVDEAGQVAIANLVAMSRCSSSIVLVGDQMQLPQPVQGVHPEGSGASTLEHLMEGQRTIEPCRGIFLPLSRRMNPAVCEIVSALAYEGRLMSDDGATRHRLDGLATLPSTGVVFDEIEHTGSSQTSREEATRIVERFEELLGSTFTERSGKTRRMGIADILVVSPYNAQVNLIASMLPMGARVGTVDRFQGQEAPACLISMATSSAEEMPRDVGFLFSIERLNVAISRAQALAVVVASPRLLDVPCSTLGDLRLVNAFCGVRAKTKGGRARAVM